jgi:DNA-binding MarR family transcriptional regulator
MVADDAMHREIVAALRRIIRAVDIYSRELMESCGLTGPQLATLQQLALHRSISTGDLAREVHVSQPTMTGIIDRLETRGCLVRSPNGNDRRSIDVTISDAGRELLAAAPPLLQHRFTERLQRLPAWDQMMILATLQRVAAMMDAADLYAAPLLVTGADRL